MAGPRGYSTYHGKGPKWKILLAVLLVLVILGALTVIRLQKYVVYDDSDRPRLDLPQFSKDQPEGSGSTSADEPGDASFTIEEPEQKSIQAAALPVGPLTDWKAAWAAVSPGGVNAVVYTVKDTDGLVYIDSQAAPPTAAKTVEGSAAALGDMLKDEGVYAVAKIACFRDPVASSADLVGRGLINTGGYVFYDGNNERWLDPSKVGARQYLVDLATACAAAGFDEILLTDVNYPTIGKLNKIDYGLAATGRPDSLRQGIDAFLTEMKAALAEYDVKLAIMLPPELFAPTEDLTAEKFAAVSGQSLGDIVPLMDRVYVTGDGTALDAIRTRLAAISKDAELAPMVAQPGTLENGESYFIAP
ncbi:putative glycoside hydrolase [Oscillibacter sp.]|uniref:putative glycoside hydrolase n=1 Tax=Oscillibacter sp. TaxID=1945593 RepID=UPI0028AC6074|nr:putative glycoside hydrolase [Oscillibacter sp.]